MKKFIPWILSIVAAIVATWLLAWRWEKYRETIEKHQLLVKPDTASIEAMTEYKKRVNLVIEDIAQAEAEEMVDKWRKRFGKH